MKENSDIGEVAQFSRLLGIIRELRVRCPWDREQRLEQAANYLVEEAYEAADAIARSAPDDIAEELGDLMIAVLFAMVIGEQADLLKLDGVIRGAADKLVRRHAHVYGEIRAETADEVLESWEKLKREEKKAGGRESTSQTHGRGLPALIRAEKLGEEARRAGMDWADAREVLEKVREELGEAEDALERGDQAAAIWEVGDMMLALANVPRFLGRTAEQTLRLASEKFIVRFEEVRSLAEQRNLDLKKLDPGAVEALWQEAKRALGTSGDEPTD